MVIHLPFNVEFNNQSNVNLNDWISNLTLCLAPLLTHLIVGVPSPVYLCQRRPRWHNYIGHFNPTSIIWRYFAITDRRANTKPKNWTSTKMSASNALFWTSDGWDGSEQMIAKSARFLIRKPQTTRIDIFSFSALKTVVITFQGLQALLATTSRFFGGGNFRDTISIATIFFPLAMLGLLRLPAALWLADTENCQDSDEPELTCSSSYELTPARSLSANDFGSTTLPTSLSEGLATKLQPACSWCGLLVRGFYFLSILFLFGGALAFSLMPARIDIHHLS